MANSSTSSDEKLLPVGQRLREAVRAAGGLDKVSLIVGVSKRSLSRYIAGAAEMPALTAVDIAKATRVSLNWLLEGADDDGSGNAGLRHTDDSVSVPLLNIQGSAGNGIHSNQEYEVTRIPFSRSLLRELGVAPENCHFIRGKGDSMVPTIPDGGIVLVDASRTIAREDGIYALMAGDDVRIKRVQFGAFGGLTLKSDNPAYSEETIGRGDIDQIKIVGKVVWVGGVV